MCLIFLQFRYKAKIEISGTNIDVGQRIRPSATSRWTGQVQTQSMRRQKGDLQARQSDSIMSNFCSWTKKEDKNGNYKWNGKSNHYNKDKYRVVEWNKRTHPIGCVNKIIKYGQDWWCWCGRFVALSLIYFMSLHMTVNYNCEQLGSANCFAFRLCFRLNKLRASICNLLVLTYDNGIIMALTCVAYYANREQVDCCRTCL